MTFGQSLWLLLLCLTGTKPDALIATANNFWAKTAVVIFGFAGIILLSILIGNVATFFLEEFLVGKGPKLKSKVKRTLKNHIVFLGWSNYALSILKEIKSSDLSEKIPVVIVTNEKVEKYKADLSTFSDIFWVEGVPFSPNKWKLADLKFAKSIYLFYSEQFYNGAYAGKYFNALNKVLCRYLNKSKSKAFAVLYVKGAGNDIKWICDKIHIIRESSYSDDILSSSVVSPMFSKVLSAIMEHKAGSEIYVKENPIIKNQDISDKLRKFGNYTLVKFKEYLHLFNIDFIAYSKIKSFSEDNNQKHTQFRYVGLSCNTKKKSKENEIMLKEIDNLVLLAQNERDINNAIG